MANNELDFLKRLQLADTFANSSYPASESAKAFELPNQPAQEIPNIITDPNDVLAKNRAAIEQAFRNAPNRAAESAGAFQEAGPNFDMIGEPSPTSSRPNFKMQGQPYTPDMLPATIEAPVPTVKGSNLPAVRNSAGLPDIAVKGTPIEMNGRMMGMNAIGAALPFIHRYITKPEGEDFFPKKEPYAEANAIIAKANEVKKGKEKFPINPKETSDKTLAGAFKGKLQPEEMQAAFGKKEEQASPILAEEQASELASKINSAIKNPMESAAKAEHEVAKAEAAMKKPDATDTEMEAAIAQRDKNLFFGRLMAAANDFGAALGGANAQILKADNTLANDVISRSDQPVKDVGIKRDSMNKKMELDREKAKNDPASPVSQLYREALFKVAPELAKDPRYAQMSAYDAEKAFPAITGAFNAVENREQRKQDSINQEANRQLQRDQMDHYKGEALKLKRENQAGGYQKEAQKNVKDIEGKIDAAEQIHGLINKAETVGGVNLSAVGANLAKLMEGGGVKTDADVTRYMARPDVAGRMKDALSKTAGGKMHPESAKALRNMVNDITGIMKQNRDQEYRKQAINYSRNTGMNEAEALKLINPYHQSDLGESPVAAKAAPKPGDTVRMNGKRYSVAPDGEMTEIK